jgi:hypothetical protein
VTAPTPGLPVPWAIHVLDAAGNELPPDQIPSTSVGGKGKTNMTILRVELWVDPTAAPYWNATLHLFLRAS